MTELTVKRTSVVLSFSLGSGVLLVTLATFARIPVAVGLTRILTVAMLPFASVPRLHRTFAVPLQLPWLASTEMIVTSGAAWPNRARLPPTWSRRWWPR